MSSTYPHYASASTSLPNDYAVLSHYRSSRSSIMEDSTDDDTSTLSEGDGVSASSPAWQPDSFSSLVHPTAYGSTSQGRRRSFPAPAAPHMLRNRSSSDRISYYFPTPTAENQPLLGEVPRIDEECDNEDTQGWALWWEETRVLLSYTWPVFLYSLVIASVVSIGHISTTALAAATLGSMTASVSGLSIIQGMASALDSLLPQAWTSPEPKSVGLWTHRMTIVMSFTLIPIGIIWWTAEGILLFLRQEPEVAHLAGVYLRWISIGLPAYAFNVISRRYYQSQGLLHVPSMIIAVVAPINAVLNYLLVWGPDPIRLGFKGAPLATGISFNLISFASLGYGLFVAPRTAWSPITRKSFDKLGVVAHLGLGGVGQTASEWWSWELVGLAASLLGPVALATQSVLLVSASTSYQAPFALSVATSVRIGNLLGSGHAVKADVACRVSLLIALALSAVSSTIFLVFRHSWGYLFNDDIEVVTLVAQILPLVALFQVFDGLAGITAGILRARGRQFTGALLNLSAYYILGVPLGLLLTFQFNMELIGLWLGLSAALLYGSAFGVYLSLKTNWVKEVRRVQERLKDDHVKQGEGAEGPQRVENDA